MAAIDEHGIVPIDLVAVNLYPFQMTISRRRRVVRGRGGEHRRRRPLHAPLGGQEPRVRAAGGRSHRLRQGAGAAADGGPIEPAMRREFAAKVFAHTADYDAAIAGYLTPKEDGLPSAARDLAMERLQTLRYGENPGQRAALYVTEEPRGHAGPDPAPGQGALVQQPARHRRRDVPRWRAGPTGRPARHQAHHALRHRGRQHRASRPSGRPGRPTRSRRSARWSPSTPWWTGPPPRR